jgi:hypothetical protein
MRECTLISKHRLPKVCGRQCPSLTETVAKLLEVAALIVHFGDDRLAEWASLVPRAGYPDQISERKKVAAQMINCADQAKAPAAVAQRASVPVPAVVEELLDTNQILVSAADLFG